MKRSIFASALLLIVLCASSASATLFDRGSGLIYDDVLKITWLQDANYAKTSGFDADGFITNWTTAVSWADNLVYQGFSDWRLPYISVTAGAGPFGGSAVNCTTASELACRDNEYGYMFYHNLNGTLGSPETGNQVGDGITLNNIQTYYYWSGTKWSSIYPWAFTFDNGSGAPGYGGGWVGYPDSSFAAWAVRPGDSVRVPEPGSALLLGAGLLALRLARRCRKV